MAHSIIARFTQWVFRGMLTDSVGAKYGDYLAGMLKNDGFSEVAWQYVTDATDYGGYAIFPAGDSPAVTDIQRKACVFNDEADIPHNRLCVSPWQQVVKIIGCHDLATGSLTNVTHGQCFQRCSRSSRQPVERFLVTVRQTDDYREEDAAVAVLLDENERQILADSRVELLGMWESECVPLGVAAVGACVSMGGRRYRVDIVDVSAIVRGQWNIRDDCQEVDVSVETLAILQAVFPTRYAAPQPIRVDAPLADGEQARLLGQRGDLDCRLFRDMSFWWPREDCCLGALLEKVAEICRCVLASHEDGPVTLVDDFRHGDTRCRSVCVRMPIRSGLVSLSKANINRMQSAVRLHCQDLLHVVLR